MESERYVRLCFAEACLPRRTVLRYIRVFHGYPMTCHYAWLGPYDEDALPDRGDDQRYVLEQWPCVAVFFYM